MTGLIEANPRRPLADPSPDKNAHPMRQKRMFDVGHTSSGMTFDLRCSSRLRLRSWGLDSVVQQMLGHKSATMTLDLYGHLFPDQLDEVADRLDAAARAVVYPLCTRADIIPMSVG
jgi:integrase